MTDTKTPEASKMRNRLNDNPTISYWLKRALQEMEERDPVDALNDAEKLKEYCSLRLNEINKYYK